ncbi:uncharacterized protein LACBIDRAFT_296857 [Laccaria bicolor S238N-H82]|uniref:Predicted protein n=1 Tax=Laccaria bicolor (strain S238N-H82 / ATCC MYA-4686) TaxID=486041 RepID=B0D9F5_LACBS|nr:uncharacterized protein LACBIDRAFT_296857 [Laccaria bicolor S238N-H82]EDR08570.1 predicted protein [Laccaria bicolor S238N-H82]|eukprot:XP_001880795.1 predicted protein [Laccaria bicolor S238N-H82]
MAHKEHSGNFVCPSSHSTILEIPRFVRQFVPKKQVQLQANVHTATSVESGVLFQSSHHSLGHGYASYEHVDHEPSFTSQSSSISPTSPNYCRTLSSPQTNHINTSYSSSWQPTSPFYTRIMQHNQGAPGIFFKFDSDPLAITQHQ